MREMPLDVFESLDRILEKVWDEHKRDWESSGFPEAEHLFLDLTRVNAWLGANRDRHLGSVLPETPLGSALANLPVGAACSTVTVLVCPHCQVAYVDEVPLGEPLDFCGPCQYLARHTGEFVCKPLRRRPRTPRDSLALGFRR